MSGYDFDDADVQELLAERDAARRYRNALDAHPDPRDPEYPGGDEGGAA